MQYYLCGKRAIVYNTWNEIVFNIQQNKDLAVIIMDYYKDVLLFLTVKNFTTFSPRQSKKILNSPYYNLII